MSPTDGRCPESNGPTMEQGQRLGRYLLGRTVDDRTMNDRTMNEQGPTAGPETGPDDWNGPRR